MDTVGPTKTTSVHGYRYNTTFTCGYSCYVLLYGHASPSQIPELQERWYADIARFRELHGEPRVFRCAMLLSMFHAVQPLSEWLREFALKQFVPQKVIRQVRLST